ncbi:MAG: lanthionine synthetase LanC family protein [Candidatus Levyibacteriota bacterium]
MNDVFLKEAIRIGNQFLDLAEQDDHGISWKTMTLDAQGKVMWHKADDLYSGNSGIVLFLLELYKQTGDAIYLSTVEKAMMWIEWYCNSTPTQFYSLVRGRLGVSYTFLKLYEVTGKKRYLQKALAIAKSCPVFLNHPQEYFNGTAGIVLALLHLYAASGEQWLLGMINDAIQSLIKKARLVNTGLYWDKNYLQVRPLCGFSHGSSGIGFVFLELGHYFDNPAFYAVAEQAFLYENAWFDAKSRNWPDFRLSIGTEQKNTALEKAYEAGDSHLLTSAGDLSNWCNGATGIGLSRLRAYELNQKEGYKKDIQRSLTRVKQTTKNLSTFSLCHGIGGNADEFIENYLLFHSKQDLEYARQLGNFVLHQRKKFGRYISGMGAAFAEKQEDTSLFNGLAGIGYFFLRLYDPEKTSSILAPKISGMKKQKDYKNLPFLTINLSTMHKCLIRNIFPTTLHLVAQYSPQIVDEYFKKGLEKNSVRASFIQFIDNLPLEHNQDIKDAFLFELVKIELAEQSLSNGLLYIRERIQKKKANRLLHLADAVFLKCSLTLTTECKLFITKREEYFLLKLTPTGVDEIKISKFCLVVLQAFSKPKKVVEVVSEVSESYKIADKAQKKMVQGKVIEQIQEAVANTILSS